MLVFLLACFGSPPPHDTSPGRPDSAGDSDTTGDTADTGEGCVPDPDGDGWCEDDCAPGNPEVNPGAPEVCNGEDDDCDDAVDEDLGGTYYADEDGDGFGDPAATRTACEPPGEGWADNGADCDDTRDDAWPGADEAANGEDDDCDGEVDEGVVLEVSVEVVWDRDGATVTITGGVGAFDFGMAETGAGDLGWFGESCIPGDEPGGYPDYEYDVCHTLAKGGGTLTHVGKVADVEDGLTLFTDVIASLDHLTYVLLDHTTDACWVWGHDPSYYDDFDCTEL